jgi:hypothetical protein
MMRDMPSSLKYRSSAFPAVSKGLPGPGSKASEQSLEFALIKGFTLSSLIGIGKAEKKL